MTQADQARAQVLATLQESLDSVKQALEAEQFPMTNYVVVSGTLCLKFDITNGVVSAPEVCGLAYATRFTKINAVAVAAKVCNGLDEVAQAMTVQAAAVKIIASIQRSIDIVKKAGGL